jgi:HlyD family secretion protein
MKKIIITLVVIAAIAASVGGYYYTRPGPEPKVTTAAVTRGDVTESVGATGTFEAITSVTVGSQVSGTIQALNADFNSIVTKGQVIARLDPALMQTQLEQSQANLVRAQADLERLKVTLEDAKVKLARADGLFKRQLVTQADLETAQVNVKSADAQLKSSQAALTQAEAAVNQNKVNVEHTVISAPIDGIVVSRNVDIGQTVAASFNAPTLFIIAADLTKMKCTANIDESDVGRIRPGQNVRIRVDAYANEEFTGRVAQVRLQPSVVQNVVTYGTVIEVPNNDLKLKPGMTANVTIEVARKTDVVRVPNAATRFRPSTEIFAALKQPVPPELQRGMGGRGGTGMAGGFGAAGGTGRGGDQAGAGAAAAGGSNAQAQTGARGSATPGQTAQSARPPQVQGQQAQAPSAPQGGAGLAGRPSERGGGDRPPAQAGERGGFPGAGGERGGFAGGGQGGERGAFAGGMGPGGGQGPGGGRGFDPNDPERRARMMERLQQMPPEQREQFIARLKERGINIELPGAAGASKGAAKPAPAKTTGAPSADGLGGKGAQTIDSLFGPLPARVSFGRAWIYTTATKQLKSVRLRLGVTDGTWTELLDGELQPGQELVTGIIIDDGTKTSTTGANSPLMQRGGPMGGPPMGGGRGR